MKNIAFNVRVKPAKKIRGLTLNYNLARIAELTKAVTTQPLLPRTRESIEEAVMLETVRYFPAIDGPLIDREEAKRVISLMDKKSKSKQLKHECVNAYGLYQFILNQRLEPALEINAAFIKEVHTLISQNVYYPGNIPGQFRDVPLTVSRTTYKPPLSRRHEIIRALGELGAWLASAHQATEAFSPLVVAVLTHFYLTEICPFGRGNGRTARALEALILARYASLRVHCWGLIPYYFRNHERYFELLEATQKNRDATELTVFVSDGLIQHLESIRRVVVDNVQEVLFTEYLRQLEDEKILKKGHLSLMRLIENAGSLEYNKFMKGRILGTSADTKRRYIRRLLALNVITIRKEDRQKHIVPNYGVLYKRLSA